MVILHSKDLVNWTIVGHAVNDLKEIGPDLNWDRMNRYGKGRVGRGDPLRQGAILGLLRHARRGLFHDQRAAPRGAVGAAASRAEKPWLG